MGSGGPIQWRELDRCPCGHRVCDHDAAGCLACQGNGLSEPCLVDVDALRDDDAQADDLTPDEVRLLSEWIRE